MLSLSFSLSLSLSRARSLSSLPRADVSDDRWHCGICGHARECADFKDIRAASILLARNSVPACAMWQLDLKIGVPIFSTCAWVQVCLVDIRVSVVNVCELCACKCLCVRVNISAVLVVGRKHKGKTKVISITFGHTNDPGYECHSRRGGGGRDFAC